jgi:hypothetical protein
MHIILSQCTVFNEHEIKKDAAGNKVASVVNTITVRPSTKPQPVPDWIKKDEMFKLLAKDGKLLEVVPVQQEESSLEQKPEPKPSTGWGAQNPNVGLGFTGKANS